MFTKRSVGAILVAFCSILSARAQTWQPIQHRAPIYAGASLLLLDGTILVQDSDSSDWWKYTPSDLGDYTKGTRSQVASTPGYGPSILRLTFWRMAAYSSWAADTKFGSSVWQTTGYIYDPVANAGHLWLRLPVGAMWATRRSVVHVRTAP